MDEFRGRWQPMPKAQTLTFAWQRCGDSAMSMFMKMRMLLGLLSASCLPLSASAQLTSADVTRIINQAVTRAVAISPNSVIAVTDREGDVDSNRYGARLGGRDRPLLSDTDDDRFPDGPDAVSAAGSLAAAQQDHSRRDDLLDPRCDTRQLQVRERPADR